MTDLFDRVAAQALGLGLALRPRSRSRFEPAEADMLGGDLGWGEVTPYREPPSNEEAAGAPLVVADPVVWTGTVTERGASEEGIRVARGAAAAPYNRQPADVRLAG